jgi:hypothetical protein
MSALASCTSRLPLLSSRLALGAFVAAFGLSVSAHASSIVSDSGFESAGTGITSPGNQTYYPGQSIDGGSWNVGAGQIFIDINDPYVYADNNSVNLTGANPYEFNSLFQTIATVAGGSYNVSFYANADSANTFLFTENGVVIAGTPSSIADNGFPGSFSDYTGRFTATSSSTTLDFTAISDPTYSEFQAGDGSVVIDNVNVASTPEPSSILLLMTGVAGLGQGVVRRRFARSAASK